jgi:hypothetical protein
VTHNSAEHAYFVFAFRSGRGGDMSFLLEGCKVLALRTWLGTGINTAKFQEVLILDGVFMGQVIDHSCFFQEFKTLCDRAFDFHLAKLYLCEKQMEEKRPLIIEFLFLFCILYCLFHSCNKGFC